MKPEILATVSFFLFQLIHEGLGIKCYVCNSANDPRCGDPFNPRTIELFDCDQFKPRQNSTLCRKNVQKVSLGKREDLRVVRTCGFIPDKVEVLAEGEDESQRAAPGKCYTRAGTFEVLVTFCTCSEEGCNGVGRQKVVLDFVSMTFMIIICKILLF